MANGFGVAAIWIAIPLMLIMMGFYYDYMITQDPLIDVENGIEGTGYLPIYFSLDDPEKIYYSVNSSEPLVVSIESSDGYTSVKLSPVGGVDQVPPNSIGVIKFEKSTQGLASLEINPSDRCLGYVYHPTDVDGLYNGPINRALVTLTSMIIMTQRDNEDALEIAENMEDRYTNRNRLAEELYYYVRDTISYVSDKDLTGFPEYPQTPNEVLDRRMGDCEDYAILLAAMYHHVGYRTRVVIIQYEFGGHATLEVKLDSGWIRLEPTGKNNPFGWSPSGHVVSEKTAEVVGIAELSTRVDQLYELDFGE